MSLDGGCSKRWLRSVISFQEPLIKLFWLFVEAPTKPPFLISDNDIANHNILIVCAIKYHVFKLEES